MRSPGGPEAGRFEGSVLAGPDGNRFCIVDLGHPHA
jgi:hypothetical protein